MRYWLWLLLLVPLAAEAKECGVVVGEKTSSIRRVIVPDNPEQLKQQWAGEGERFLVIDCRVEITTQIEKQTGIAPIEPMAAVIKDGEVESLIMADPGIDSLPGKDIIRAYDGVKKGSLYDAKTETFTTDGVVVEVQEPKRAKPVTVDQLKRTINK